MKQPILNLSNTNKIKSGDYNHNGSTPAAARVSDKYGTGQILQEQVRLKKKQNTVHFCSGVTLILFSRFHEITEKWIRAHRQDYRGNRSGDLQVRQQCQNMSGNISKGAFVKCSVEREYPVRSNGIVVWNVI